MILRIAVPSIISNITVPLLGLVDTAITGHLGAAAFLAAIAVGTTLFSTTYWLFNFLRMGTGGLTAQALGAEQGEECVALLWRSLVLAGSLAVLILLFQYAILHVGLSFMSATDEVQMLVRSYYRILVWGAPPTLALFALNGWLLGMQDARAPMWTAIVQNVVNIFVSLILVVGLGWKMEGVALGTLIAQWVGAVLAFGFAWRIVCRRQLSATGSSVFGHAARWRELFVVNRDIFFRTLCLVAVMFAFTSFGARQGETLLAVNALLMQFFLIVSYVMDGFAYAGEAIGGRLCGAADRSGFWQLTRRLFGWGIGFALFFTLCFALGGRAFLHLLTDNDTVRVAAVEYLPYVVAMPLVGFSAFLLDGLFVGTTSTRAMLMGVGAASVVFFGVHALFSPGSGNHALWTAFLCYLGVRGVIQGFWLPKIVRQKFVVS
ncbi:MATE family efflux transporter [Alloprevotella sp. OH1205_COT-284]|uniref:MATE family efflux transporter n=1 Tax=Alloprevotella sp. OH1205_COT-284 TaxID=2491043 RepID=UPI000F5F2A51|nr:MATE family efflux transporter [Alloprevotella sp. OH1205_COT-284]RRD80534.1 MATE family efflux transporter [Alloprevotella sp. OH1205_COT-284]